MPLDGSALATRAPEFLLAQPNARSLEYVLLDASSREVDREQADVRLEGASHRVRELGATTVETAVIVADAPVEVAEASSATRTRS